jgi:hypothetical protein
MTRIASTVALAGLVATTSCRHFQNGADNLYEGEPRPSAEVARLAGPIAKVDGVDVSELGPIFALLPGCHIVELRPKIGEGSANGAWSADIGRVVYALPMKAGRLYVIDAELKAGGSSNSVGNASVGGVRVRAVEEDGEGNVVAKFSKAKTKADIERCREADASLRPKPAEAAPQADASIAPSASPAASSRPGVDAGMDVGP